MADRPWTITNPATLGMLNVSLEIAEKIWLNDFKLHDFDINGEWNSEPAQKLKKEQKELLEKVIENYENIQDSIEKQVDTENEEGL